MECITKKTFPGRFSKHVFLCRSCSLIQECSLFWSNNKLLEKIMILPGILQWVPKPCGKVEVSPYKPSWIYSSVLVVKDAYDSFLWRLFHYKALYSWAQWKNQCMTEINCLLLWKMFCSSFFFFLIQLICKWKAQFSPVQTTLLATPNPHLQHIRNIISFPPIFHFPCEFLVLDQFFE